METISFSAVLQYALGLLGSFFTAVGEILPQFAFLYPLLMAYLWIIGASIYYYQWERHEGDSIEDIPELEEYPPVSIVIPCHNEADVIEETINYLSHQRYPNYEIIAVNDGSTDNTLEILRRLAAGNDKIRILNLEQNQGKAVGLTSAAMLSANEYLVTIDSDALLAPEAITWMMWHFLNGPRVGAVTGNPRIRTRSTLLGKIQVGEFSAIVGMIKRTQRVYGCIFTVSGVVAGFRKSALHRVGYWSNDMITEDIDISWKLQLDHWDIRFEPNALCWILMPETLVGLWQQRLRWAQGGSEVLLRYFSRLATWRFRRMWFLYLEYFASILWSYTMVAFMILWGVDLVQSYPNDIPPILPSWYGVLLALTCLLQFAVSMMIDSRYEAGMRRRYYWMVWYPVGYWLINVFTTVVAVPKAIFKKRGQRAIWESPDRGIHS